MTGKFISRRENVLLIGNSGTGKTHLSTAVAFAACQQGHKVRFVTATGQVTQLVERLLKPHLLAIDEFGYVPHSKSGSELLFEVIS